MSREMPDIARLLRGVEFKVYQAHGHGGRAAGPWHAHVSGLRRGDLDDLALRPASVTAQGIAYAIERKAAGSTNDGLGYRQALREVLDSYASRYRVTFNDESTTGGTWTDVGFCSSADEARERACLIIGWVLGRRLAQATAAYTPAPVPVPAVCAGAFA